MSLMGDVFDREFARLQKNDGEFKRLDKKLKEQFIRAGRQGRLSKKKFEPATKNIGCFDAKFEPQRNLITITVSLSYSFERDTQGQGPTAVSWTSEDISTFKTKAKQVIEEFWSDRFTLTCSRPDWLDIYAQVKIKLVEPKTGKGVYHAVVKKYPDTRWSSGAAINRETREAKFGNFDVEPNVSDSRDKAGFAFKKEQLSLAVARNPYIAFDKGTAKISSAGNFALLPVCQELRKVFGPGRPDNLRIYVYGKTGSNEGRHMPQLGKRRAKAVKDYLQSKFPTQDNFVEVVDSFAKEPWIEAPMKAALQKAGISPQDQASRNFSGVVMAAGAAKGREGTDMETQNRNYIVIVHEFGHMLGLPDEYQGVNCLAMKELVDLRTCIPESTKKMQNLASQSDEARTQQAQGFAKLLRDTGLPSPMFSDNNPASMPNSIMYGGGSEIYPAHYLTIWQAMTEMCLPYLLPHEWKIVPNATGSANRSDLSGFVT